MHANKTTLFYLIMYAGQIEIVLEFKLYLWPSQTCSDFAVSFML